MRSIAVKRTRPMSTAAQNPKRRDYYQRIAKLERLVKELSEQVRGRDSR